MSRPHTFASFGEPLPNLSSSDRRLLFDALPERTQDRMWHRLAVQIDDRRYADGLAAFTSLKPTRRPASPTVHATNRTRSVSDDWRRGTEALASIPAETYLEVLTPESEPHRGKCRCPLPDHEDNNPSATYRDSVWFCHVCGTGGGIFRLGSALSGHHDHGPEFTNLRKWLAERLLGAAV